MTIDNQRNNAYDNAHCTHSKNFHKYIHRVLTNLFKPTLEKLSIVLQRCFGIEMFK